MREIKFRTSHYDLKGFVAFTYWEIDKETFLHEQSRGGYKNTIIQSIEQYTSLKDKNGKEIYEGDILRVENYSYDSYNVVYGYSGFRLKSDEQTQNEPFPNKHFLEVIGNIHENKELIK